MLNEAGDSVEGATQVGFALVELFEGCSVVVAEPIVGGLATVWLGAPRVGWHVTVVPASAGGEANSLKVALVVLQEDAQYAEAAPLAAPGPDDAGKVR